MSQAIYDRAIWYLLKFGRLAFDGFTYELTGKETKPHECFPQDYRELVQALMSCTGSVVMPNVERITGKKSHEIINRVALQVYDSGEQVTLKMVREHAREVAKLYKNVMYTRKVSALGAAVQSGQVTSEQADAEYKTFSAELASIGSKRVSRYAKDIAAATIQELDDIVLGKKVIILKSGFSKLDRIGFLRRAEIAGIAGESKSGKTTEAMQIAHYAAEHAENGCVIVFSMEMNENVLFQQLAAARLRFDLDKIHDGKVSINDPDYVALKKEVDRIGQLPLIVEPRTGLTAIQMQEVVDYHAAEYGNVNLIVLDYARLASANKPTGMESKDVEAVFQEFKAIVKNHINADGTHPAGLVITELNRNDSGGAIPTRKNIKFAGDYTLHCCIAPFNPHDHLDDKKVSSYIEATGELNTGEMWQVCMFARYGSPGIMRGFRFLGEYHRWEQGQW